jgi:hypothetical protein
MTHNFILLKEDNDMRNSAIFLAMSVFIFLFLFPSVNALTYVGDCMTLSTDNELYVMQNNITRSNVACILITGENITFDMMGHWMTITRTGVGSAYGIRVQANDTHILNGTINMTNLCVCSPVRAIDLVGADNINIEDLNIYAYHTSTRVKGIYSVGGSTRHNWDFDNVRVISDSIDTAMEIDDIDDLVIRNSAFDSFFNSLVITNSINVYGCNVSTDGTDYSGSINVTILSTACPPPCDCGAWIAGGCANTTHVQYIRTCSPSGCGSEAYYVADTQCDISEETSTFFNQYVLAITVIITISLGLASVVNDQHLVVFLSSIFILVFFLSAVGFFPQWIIWISLAGLSLLFAKFIMGVIK